MTNWTTNKTYKPNYAWVLFRLDEPMLWAVAHVTFPKSLFPLVGPAEGPDVFRRTAWILRLLPRLQRAHKIVLHSAWCRIRSEAMWGLVASEVRRLGLRHDLPSHDLRLLLSDPRGALEPVSERLVATRFSEGGFDVLSNDAPILCLPGRTVSFCFVDYYDPPPLSLGAPCNGLWRPEDQHHPDSAELFALFDGQPPPDPRVWRAGAACIFANVFDQRDPTDPHLPETVDGRGFSLRAQLLEPECRIDPSPDNDVVTYAEMCRRLRAEDLTEAQLPERWSNLEKVDNLDGENRGRLGVRVWTESPEGNIRWTENVHDVFRPGGEMFFGLLFNCRPRQSWKLVVEV